MPNAESITVSLEWAKKLKEAGWRQEDSIHYWCPMPMKDNMILVHRSSAWVDENAILSDVNIAAPTAEEILRRLPAKLDDGCEKRVLRIMKNTENDKYEVCYETYAMIFEDGELPYYEDHTPQEYDTLANAAAAICCYISDNKLLP